MQSDNDLNEDTLSLHNVNNATAKRNESDAQLSSPGNAAMHAQAILEVRNRGKNFQPVRAFDLNPKNKITE